MTLNMTWRKRLQAIVDSSETRPGRIFTFTIQGIIVLSLISFSCETLPDLSSRNVRWLYLFEVLTIVIFTLEYLLRILAAEKKRAFIFSFFGLIDLFAILPFYLSTGIDLRAIRIFRLLRLVRLLKLLRFNQAIKRFQRAFILAREELILSTMVTMILLYLAAVGIYYFERTAQPEVFSSIFHSLWWAVTTLTTVGYGDSFPVTVGGKIFTFLILMIGLGIVAVPTGLVASALSQARSEERESR